MADLYHLLDELDESTEDHNSNNEKENLQHSDDNEQQQQQQTTTTYADETTTADDADDGRIMVVSKEQEWDRPDHVDDVPLVLQEAMMENDNIHDNNENDVEENEDDFNNDIYRILDEQEEFHVENEIYSKMETMWKQERHCPDLLPYDINTIQSIKQKLDDQQELVDELEINGGQQGQQENAAVTSIMATLGQIDIDRTKFVVSDWLTCRLAKIEAYPIYMRDYKLNSMSSREIQYLKQYGTLLEQHLHQSVLQHIPTAWQRLDESNMIEQPNQDEYHFWLVKENLKISQQNQNHDDDDDVDGGDYIEHDAGTCLVAKYKDMKDHMANHKVELQI